jgi:hypothetical protein
LLTVLIQFANNGETFALLPKKKFASEVTKQQKKFTLMQKMFALMQKKVYLDAKKVYIFAKKVCIIYQKMTKMTPLPPDVQ